MSRTNGKCHLYYFSGHCVRMVLIIAILWYFASCGYVYLYDNGSAQTKDGVYLKAKYDAKDDTSNEKQIFASDAENQIDTSAGKKKADKAAWKSGIPLRFLQNISKSTKTFEEYISVVPDASTLHVDFLHLPKNACDPARVLTVGVKSSISHFDQRATIRSTWASYQSNYSASVVFLLGLPSHALDKNTEERISSESTLYNDVVQGTFVDGYSNLTVKSIMGLRWFYEFCRTSRFFMLVDDDVYLDLGAILSYYTIDTKYFTRVLHCGEKMIMHARVVRRGIWATPFQVYNFTHYPPYCGGVCYIMSQDVASKLYTTSLITHTDIGVDDAMICGIIREKARIEMERMPKGLCVNLVNTQDIEEKIHTLWKKRQETKSN